MKYIDAEKLKAEIKKRMNKHWDNLPDADSPEDDWTHNELCELGAYKELEHIEDFLNSLQQEQPEIDLEKAAISFGDEIGIPVSDAFLSIARHFYELGRKQVLQEIYDGKTKPVDKITAAWLDDKEEDN